jgi:hypothetical protein
LINALKINFQNLALTCNNQKFDEIFSSTINFPHETGNEVRQLKFGEALIELFKRFTPKEVARVALESTVFREYMDEKIYEFVINFEARGNEEILCIILHLLKKDEISAANTFLDQIKREDLYQLLTRHWNILFEFSSNSTSGKKISKTIISFSDFTELLFLTHSSNKHCELFTDVLIYHIYDTKTIKLHAIIKLFMEYLASQFGQHDCYVNGQNILKMILEKYLLRYYESRVQDPEVSLLSSSGNTTTISAASSTSENQHKNERKHSFMSWNDDDLQGKLIKFLKLNF